MSKETVKAAKGHEKISGNAEETIVSTNVGVIESPVNSAIAGSEESSEISIEKKLFALYTLQQIDSQIDKIRIIRGELPLEVEDLEDEIAGLETRTENYIEEIDTLQNQ